MVLKTRGNGITVFEDIDGKATWEFIGNSLEFTVIDKKNGVEEGVVCQNFANFTANFTGFAVFFAKNNYKLIAVIIIN